MHNYALNAMTRFRDRRSATIENSDLRVTVLEHGGHIAEIFDKGTRVNPLWIPPWPSIEPATFDPQRHTAYGSGDDARLLAGIVGHNLCLDIFGGPSPAEAAVGLTPHGEGSIERYDIELGGTEMIAHAHLPLAQMTIERRIELQGRAVRIRERVTNLAGIDRPIGWTQHVTLGPPFLQKGLTEFRASAARSKVYESDFGAADYLQVGAVFDWPHAPRLDGRTTDLCRFTDATESSAYTAHLMDPNREDAFFVAFSADSRLAFGYVWQRSDFPWMGIWEENYSRVTAPWNGQTLARGMEFGVSPFPESRQAMVKRGSLFDTPTFRWLPAKGRLEVEYWAVARSADCVPETLARP